MAATEWFFLQLLIQPTYKIFFPSLYYIAEVAVTLPVTNAWPERRASALKHLKTKHRNRTNNYMLSALLQVCINDPEVADAGKVVKEAVRLWMGAKKRKKLSKRKKSSGPPSSYLLLLILLRYKLIL